MTFSERELGALERMLSTEDASAHCDIPCGIYDPHAAQVAALTVIRMVQLIQNLPMPEANAGPDAMANFGNSMSRYIAVKEEHAIICKREILILWTDFFKPEHLEKAPDLHDLFWKTAKLCSTVKQKVDMEASQQLLANVQKIAETFWQAKGVATKRQPTNQTAGGEFVYPTA